MFQTVVECAQVQGHLGDPGWVIVDCRFQLGEPDAGIAAYTAAHIPGAVYAHLDHDLSGPPVTDHGRHPLPTPERLRETFSRFGIDAEKQVVVYDDSGGAYAARLWWLLRYMEHEAVALLNGGWPAWQEAGLPVAAGLEHNPPASFHGQPRREWLVRKGEVPAVPRLIDSRAPERYRGEVEPIDRLAGHIPGAINYPYARNLDESGRMLPASQVRQQLEEAAGEMPAEAVVFYCGSGVSACLNLLAQAYAGLPLGRLYAGSWSDWISDSPA